MNRKFSAARCRLNRCWQLAGTNSLLIATAALLLTGCEEEPRNTGKRPATRALDQTGVSVGFDDDSREKTRPRPAAKQTGPIIGQRTTEIRDAKKEVQQGGAVVATTKITAKDYITLQGNAYVTVVGRTSVLMIQQAMDLYYAENARYPKDYDEFISVIIKANNISLPQLPPYQKYGYDEKEHKLIILEYPDLKNQPGPR
jgi:hypothetical protein